MLVRSWVTLVILQPNGQKLSVRLKEAAEFFIPYAWSDLGANMELRTLAFTISRTAHRNNLVCLTRDYLASPVLHGSCLNPNWLPADPDVRATARQKSAMQTFFDWIGGDLSIFSVWPNQPSGWIFGLITLRITLEYSGISRAACRKAADQSNYGS